MSFIKQLKIILWKNNKIFWKERLKLIALCLGMIISVVFVYYMGIYFK